SITSYIKFTFSTTITLPVSLFRQLKSSITGYSLIILIATTIMVYPRHCPIKYAHSSMALCKTFLHSLLNRTSPYVSSSSPWKTQFIFGIDEI
ncbi:hypothetical protein L9F63_022940, partial [Diploptera punctata]